MPLDDNEAWLHPIKAISVKRDKPGVPRPEGTYNSGHEPSDEEELHDYQARFAYSSSQPCHYSPAAAVPPGPACPASRTPPAIAATTAVTRPITREVSFTLSCSFIASGDIGHFCLGGVGGDRVLIRSGFY